MPSEAQIEKKLVKYCREHRIYCRKFSSPSNRGVPDRILGKDGKVLFMELKRPGNKPTALQLNEGKILQSHQLAWVWCDSYELAVEEIMKFFYLHEPVDPRDLI